MIICSRSEANQLIGVEENLFKSDERNRDIISEYIDYETRELRHGRSEGAIDIGEERRKEIATLALTSGMSKEEVAKYTGSSVASVGAYKRGDNATYQEGHNEGLKEHVESVKTQVVGAAQNKLMLAIEALTGEKIHGSKGRDIAGIAKDMSQIIRNMNPDSGNLISNSKVIIYQPRVKEEDDFDTITVSE